MVWRGKLNADRNKNFVSSASGFGRAIDACAPSSVLGIVMLSMNSDYHIDTDTIFARHPFAREIMERLTGAGYEAVLIGGVVRDAMRSILDPLVSFSPHEVDIATSALPQEVRSLFNDRPIVGV